jgi:hypothetical protein
MMSCLTTSVTVAVRARIGVSGNFCLMEDRFSYYALKSLPQVETQCTSSMITLLSCPLWYTTSSTSKNCWLRFSFSGVQKITMLF